MVKRFFAEKGLILLLGILLSALAISFTYYRMENAKKDLTDYWLAKSCPSQENCREKTEARILESQEKTILMTSISKTGKTSSWKDSTYFVWLLINNSEKHKIEISPDTPSNGTPFDIDNVRIPTGADSHFVEENFHKGQLIFVEIWHNQITLLYLDTFVDVPDAVIPPTPVLGPQPKITSNFPPKTYEIVLPTVMHPIFHQASTERDFISAVVISSLLLLVVFSSMFGKEIDKIWQRVFNKK